ncbi:CheR family methyltransferase [Clostridium beijerinckii]|uniref:Chemotaxis protein CheR n=1 Tax=Clostridium beijerinckii TaxID=1520 RepID=A0A1S9NCZ0_CLOBE|nr:protein-glutamate O-methyltransferase CheR [Clostridium beijerinckii]MZK51642.1 protein-glutamate O-methyltransferase CheR [Clostridium beijerinckii]MZK60385.1 protein-glutamate O-methyltransferase CheR [Clostridium beijerinckii]MZK70202.1 protein-glutamate O-methyltransferase CheR [Clostridium beijerinckii]MZK75445.1 protein-glutamate O-methyltransferase CheR [Clostridium beijerinckii]MZK85052.1 protein-glutamate O-methyltransferase CheR [Clostridium beijerinckii]
MSIMALEQLASYIYEFCGIDYSKNLPSLESKITYRIKELGLNIWEYCGYVKIEEKERDTLIELITVNETYFFREENLLRELQTNILPKFEDYSKEKTFRIWCAACSSGEEPYTLAMLIKETMLFQNGSVEIIASDINKKVLDKAENGVYSSKSLSFRKMPYGMLDKYFDKIEDDYKVKDEIRKLVKFKNLNMFDKNIEQEVGRVDIILCRNVLIYFDTEFTKKAALSFYNILNETGYLFLGHAETVTNVNPGFDTVYTPSIFYYKKGEKA